MNSIIESQPGGPRPGRSTRHVPGPVQAQPGGEAGSGEHQPPQQPGLGGGPRPGPSGLLRHPNTGQHKSRSAITSASIGALEV